MISSVDRRSEYVENRAGANVRLNNFLTPYTLDDKSSILNAPCGYSNGVYPSLRPIRTFGSELIPNGTFKENVNGWITNNANATFVWQSDQTALFTSTSFAYVKLNPTLNLTSGTYKVSFDILSFTGTLSNVHIGLGTSGNTVTTTGSFSYNYVSSGGSTEFQIRPNSGGTGSIKIDNISVKKITEADFDFTRGSSATRVNEQGLIEDVQILSGELVQNGDFEQIGSELVTNGGFDTDSDWVKQNGWSIANETAIFSGTVSAYRKLYQENILTIGKIYKLTFDIVSINSGSIKNFSQSSPTSYDTIGTKTEYFTATYDDLFLEPTTDADITIDNVSVKEVGQNWTVANDDVNNYVEFNQEEGTVRLKFLNTSPLTTLTSDTQYLSGKKYKLTVDVKEVVSGAIKIDAAGVSELFNSVGIQERIIEPTGNSNVSFYRATADVDITLNSVSVIEITDDTDLPRIDYTNGTGSLLLEPQSTNKVTYSEDFTQWTI